MSILQPMTATVNTATRSPEFIVAITTPDISEFLTPFMLGALDAEKGELCVPAMYYTQIGQCREYAEGYESVVGRTLLSDQVMGREPLVADESRDAYLVGEMDGRKRWPQPRAYLLYTKRASIEAYMQGFQSATSGEGSFCFNPGRGKVTHLLTPEECDAELEDLREGMLDDEYHARGAW